MATRPLIDFMPHVMPHCPTAPRPLVEQALRMAAREYCERTRCWRQIVETPIDTQNEGIVCPEYATVHEIESAYFDTTNELTPTQFSVFDPVELDASANVGAPRYITQTQPNTVSIIPFQAGTLTLTLFLKPRSGSEYGVDGADTLQDRYNVVPEHLFIQSAEQIAEGALSRLLALPAETAEWSNPKMAMYYAGRFEEACSAKFNSHIKGQHRAKRRSRAHWF